MYVNAFNTVLLVALQHMYNRLYSSYNHVIFFNIKHKCLTLAYKYNNSHCYRMTFIKLKSHYKDVINPFLCIQLGSFQSF